MPESIAKVGLDLFSDEYERVEEFAEADAVLVRSASVHDLELPDTLEAIARAGAGVNNIPLDKCAEKGIVVFNTPGANANGVKELVIAGMLLAARDVIGGINWGLVGLFQFDLVAWIGGGQAGIISRIIYVVIALCALWCVSLLFRRDDHPVPHVS